MYNLHDVSYNIHLMGGGDVWGIHGVCPERGLGCGRIMTSCPVSFNEKTLVFTTKSGSKYKIYSWDTNSSCIKEKFIEQIKKDITAKAYEIR